MHALIARYEVVGAKGVADPSGQKPLLISRKLQVPGARVCRAVPVRRPLAPGRTARKPAGTVLRAISGELA